MEYVKYGYVWLGAEWDMWGEWVRGLGLGFTNPVAKGECEACVCDWVAVVLGWVVLLSWTSVWVRDGWVGLCLWVL